MYGPIWVKWLTCEGKNWKRLIERLRWKNWKRLYIYRRHKRLRNLWKMIWNWERWRSKWSWRWRR